MEPLIILAERNVHFHGIWVAGYKVTDSLLKSIGADLFTKQSRPCKLTLTSAGLTLVVLPSADGKVAKTDQIAFSDLRDVTINPYNTKCLQIVYVDAKTNKFNIMACSSPEERHLSAICGAYKDRRNFLLQTQSKGSGGQKPMNWTLRQKHRNSVDAHPGLPSAYTNELYVRANQGEPQKIPNGIASPTNGVGGFSYRHFSDDSEGDGEGEGDVFLTDVQVEVHREEEMLEREPVDGDGEDEATAFHVGIQTNVGDDHSETASIQSSSSFRSLRDNIYTLTEDMKAIKYMIETSTGISAEEYYRRRDMHGNRHAVAFHTVPKTRFITDQDDEDDATDNANDGNNNGEGYDLRSISAQTDKSKLRRYAKKPVTVVVANAYKEKISAVRKKSSGSPGNSPGGPNSSNSGSGSFADAPRSPFGMSQRSSVSSFSYQSSSGTAYKNSVLGGSSKPPRKMVPTSSTTISKPIESVYQGRKPRRDSIGRHRIVYMVTPKAT